MKVEWVLYNSAIYLPATSYASWLFQPTPVLCFFNALHANIIHISQPSPYISYIFHTLHLTPVRPYLPQNFFLLLLPIPLLIVFGWFISEPQILKFVSRHQVATSLSARYPKKYIRYPIRGTHLSMRHVRYAFARFRHSGSFMPLTLFIHPRYIFMTSLHSPERYLLV
jgi:hypothetical protein